MKFTLPGKSTSGVEVSHISMLGFWLLIGEREYFVDFDQNPWFKDATVRQIIEVELQHEQHLHWPALDVDLEIDSLVRPEQYSMIYR